MSNYNVPDLASGEIHREEEVIRRSRFIVSIARVQGPEQAKAFIDRIRAEHSDATHNCWAFQAGPAGSTAFAGCSDDGEPKGTAGRPMLTVLLHCGVGEIAAVVTPLDSARSRKLRAHRNDAPFQQEFEPFQYARLRVEFQALFLPCPDRHALALPFPEAYRRNSASPRQRFRPRRNEAKL